MIELIPIVNESPYYHVIFNYMVGDGDGETKIINKVLKNENRR